MKKNKTWVWLFILAVSACAFSLSAGNHKWQLDLAGGYYRTDPGHLNTFVQSEDLYLLFYFDPIYSGKSDQGSLEQLTSLFSGAIRLKYTLAPSLSLSFGMSCLLGNQGSEYRVEYRRDEGWRQVVDTVDYPEMNLKVKAWLPTVGVHYRLNLKRALRLEAGFCAGPLFAAVDIQRTINHSITAVFETTWPFWSSENTLNLQGSGTGLSLTGSLRAELDISRSVGVSLEGGYAWQRVWSVSGQSSETIDGLSTSISGEWGLVHEDVETPWGQARFVFPSNNWNVFGGKDEDFILDLSGAYLSLGFFIRW